MFRRLQRLLLGSLRKQLTVGMTLIVALMMALFVWDMTYRQEAAQLEHQAQQVSALAFSVATSSAEWVASRDFSGLQEIVQGISQYPNLRHVVVLDLKGQILAHTDPTKIRLFLTDLPQQPNLQVLQQTASLISITNPIVLAGKQVGWVLIGLDLTEFNDSLLETRRNGLIYALVAIALSAIFASLAGRYLTQRLNAIQRVADEVQAGRSAVRVDLPGGDEASKLATQFNAMLDALERDKQSLTVAATAFETQEGIVITDAHNVILRVNRAYSKITGYSATEVIGQNPHKIRSNRHDANFYAAMWKSINITGAWSGEIWNKRKNGEDFPTHLAISSVKNQTGAVTNYVGTLIDITEQKRSAELVWHQANFDLLTGLPNRQLFFDRLSKELSQTRRTKKRVALLFLDLDGFKAVNDTYGHDAGDIVLKVVATRWQACVREMDTVSRMGGDEFTVIVGDLNNPSDATPVAEKLIQALSIKIPLPDGTECSVGTSVGISIYPDNATEMDTLLSTADAAMFESKLRGKNTYSFSGAKIANGEDTTDWIKFNNAYLVGVYELDVQHRQLVQLINQLNSVLSKDDTELEFNRLFQSVIDMVLIHFDTELKLMKQYNYPGIASHDLEHQHLVANLENLVKQLHQGNELLALQSLKDWVICHFQTTDKSFGKFLMAQGLS